MAFSINDFKAHGLQFNGARPALFEVNFNGTAPLLGDTLFATKHQYMIKAASLPASIIDAVDVPYFGRKVKYAGDRTFANWAVTVMNDEDFVIRRAFEKWHALINSMEPNLMDPIAFAGLQYKQDAVIYQYGKQGNVIAGYNFVGMFPINVQAIATDWEATNQIEQFQVEFAFDYWVPTEGQALGVPNDFNNPSPAIVP